MNLTLMFVNYVKRQRKDFNKTFGLMYVDVAPYKYTDTYAYLNLYFSFIC